MSFKFIICLLSIFFLPGSICKAAIHYDAAHLLQKSSSEVYLHGEVVTPGPQKYICGATVSDYLGSAGGLDLQTAACENIGIIRVEGDGFKVIKCNICDWMHWQNDRLMVRPGDIIYVPPKWFRCWEDKRAIITIVNNVHENSRILAEDQKNVGIEAQ